MCPNFVQIFLRLTELSSNMERLIAKITASNCLDIDELTSGSGVNSGLSALFQLKGIDRLHIDLLFAVYVENEQAQARLVGHLLTQTTSELSTAQLKYALPVSVGAVRALVGNEYRSKECYNCKGREIDCDVCDNTRTVAVKPKPWLLCDIPRSTWYHKSNAIVREMYERNVNELFKLDAELRHQVKSSHILSV